MISRIKLKNFKLHAETALQPRLITALIGPNNSGKSSVFQSLVALRQAAFPSSGQPRSQFVVPARRQDTSQDQPYLSRQGDLIEVGEFPDIMRHRADLMTIGVTGSVQVDAPASVFGRATVGFDLTLRDNVLAHHEGSLRLNDLELRWRWPQNPQSVSSVLFRNSLIHFRSNNTFGLIHTAGAKYPTEVSGEVVAEMDYVADTLAHLPKQLLESVHFVPALRGFEESGFPLPDSPPAGMHFLTLSDRMMAMAAILAYKGDLADQLSEWLDELIGVRIRVRLLEGKRVTIRAAVSKEQRADSPITNEGSGANQLPFILLPLGMVAKGSTILLSEPEAHLHPAAQSRLVSALIDVAKREDKQILIETHSEHVLHSFLHGVTSGKLGVEDLGLYYFEEPVDRTARVRELEINKHGQVTGGLPGFFEHALSELAEFLDPGRN